MNQTDNSFSTQKITHSLISQIIDALQNKAYGSVEIYVENYSVVQISQRTITKLTPNPNTNGHRKTIRIQTRLTTQKSELTL